MTITILKSDEELDEDSERIAKAEKRGTMPYFLKDNKGYVAEAREAAKAADALKYSTANKITQSPQGYFMDNKPSKTEIINNLANLGESASHEEMHLVFNDKRVYYKRGNDNEMGITMIGENTSLWEGANLYHNHPKETLSVDDLFSAINKNLKSINAVSSNKLFTATTINNTLPNLNEKEFKNLFVEITQEHAKTLHGKEYEAFRLNMEDENMKVFCRKYKIEYKVTLL
jgi:hypothetical protein